MNRYSAGMEIHGFQLLEKRFVKEVNADCLQFLHVKSGAGLFKIASGDPNKTFAIIFKTLPESDNGAPHILEHSVLNGSKNFPVKSPFDILRKGSLNTFINAMTGKDFTMYPIASMNEKDYFNLMHVYLDAVFNPLIYTEDRILKQEGWHFELNDMESPLVYKGVVYNEMKGAFSNPLRELRYHAFRYLYPNNPYGFDSGGHPDSIVTLTQNDFLDYHRKYYHPSNSRILLYGDGDLDKELGFINEKYLQHYDKQDNTIFLNSQEPFHQIKEITEYYSLNDGNETNQQTYLSLSFITGKNTDIMLGFALNILLEVLFNQESAPVRLALEKAGIGKDISAYAGNLNQVMAQIIVQNANPDDNENFKRIFYETLNEVSENGIDKESVAGILNLIEFHLREGDDAQKGLMYADQILPGWLFVNNPFLGLEWEIHLENLKNEIRNGLLEKLLKQYFIENTHGVMLTLIPKPGLENEILENTTMRLKALKSGINREGLQHIVKETRELISFQQREDTPENIAKIPMITLQDIRPEAEWHGVEEVMVNGVKVLFHEEFTNNIVYSNLYFDLYAVPPEMIPYASLLSSLIGLLDTENYDYARLSKTININTGGMHAYTVAHLQNLEDEFMLPTLVVGGKAMDYQIEKYTDLLAELVLKSRFEEIDRLKILVGRLYAHIDSSMKRDGFQVAQKRISSYFNQSGMFTELVSGLEYYWFISELNRNFDALAGEVVNNLKKVFGMLFSRKNMIITVTSSKENFQRFVERVKPVIDQFSDHEVTKYQWQLTPQVLNEGIQAPSKIQYVVKGFNFKKLGYNYDGRLKVLNQIISTEWLQNQVRVIGGAYGGFSSFSPNGTAVFSSYRDPNLKQTLDAFDSTVDFLKEFSADPSAMTRFIIGTIARSDSPLTPSEKGETAFRYYFSGITRQNLQDEREAILHTTAEDIRNFEGLVKKIIDQQVYCVYGGETKIAEYQNLFGKLINIGNS